MILLKLSRKVNGLRPPPWYYQSKNWKAKANRIRSERGFRCELCHGRGFQCHHVTYVRCPNGERDGDIVLLCDRCHGCVHRRRWLLPLRHAVGRALNG